MIATNWRMIYHLMQAPLFPLEGHLRGEILTPEGKRVDLLIFAAHADRPEKPTNSRQKPQRPNR